MREVTIEEIEKMEDGETIPSVRGIIKDVYDRKEKGGQYPGTAQNAILVNGDSFIGLRVENHDDISHLKGKEVLISCWKNEKGMHGVKVMSGEFNDKPYHKIKVTKVGTFTVAEDGEAPSEEQEAQPSQPVKPSQQSQPTQSKAKGGELHTKKRLMQLVYLDMMCERAVQAETEKLAESGIVITPEEKMAKVGRFFISLTQKPYSEAFDYSADLPSNKYPDLPKSEKKEQPKEESPTKVEEPKEEPKKFPPQPAVSEEAPHPDEDSDDIPF